MTSFWQKALVYFGLTEDEQYEDYEEEEDFEDYYDQAVPTVRKIDRYPDLDRANRASSLRSVPPHVRVHIVEPRSFNDAQQIADKFKANIPVIMNLQLIDPDLSKRLIDFTSGLTYGLDGGMQRVAEKVFLLTPSNVEVSEAEKRKLKEKGLFNPY